MAELIFNVTHIKAGDCLVTQPWKCFTTRVDDHIWFLEHCTGPLWSIMPFGFANHLLFTLDFLSLGRMVRAHWVLMWRYLRNGGRRQVARWQESRRSGSDCSR